MTTTRAGDLCARGPARRSIKQVRLGSMIRCPTCGIRLNDDGPSCAAHGVPPSPPIQADPATPFQVPPPALPGYKIRSLLGQGGFGAAFRAERVSDGVTVAIKVARADQFSASDRLLLEAEALRAIGPPAVPAVYDVGRLADGAAYIVMEFVRAPTLAAHLVEAAGPLSTQRFSREAPAIVTLVALAHEKGFLHCDLKPDNIFIAADPVEAGYIAKLFDFGLVRRVGARPADDTREEAPEGTPDYMSPEQCEGGSSIDARSDVYSLGVLLYEMAVGAPPFWGNAALVQQNHRSKRPPLPSRRAPMIAGVEEIILRCLAKDPERRFESAAALGAVLREALANTSAPEMTPTRVMPSAPGTPGDTGNRPKPAAASRERRAVALAFLDSTSNVSEVRDAISVAGGQLAHTAGAQVVIAFGHEVGDNPTRAAAVAAQLFIDRGLCRRVYVDLASVSIQARPDGSRRYQSPLFGKKDQYPTDSDPAGVLLSRTAADVLPDISTTPVAGRAGVVVVVLVKSEDAPELTTTRAGISPLIGRDEILRVLLEAARRATSVEPGQVALPTISTLVGEPGTGKSHLTAVLIQNLETIMPPVKVLAFRAKEALGGAGDQTTRELFRHILRIPAAGPADFGRALLADRLGPDLAREVWAGVAVTMGWVSPDHPAVRSLSAAPGALRSATARAAGEGLRALARQTPLALVLEDAHFADETALDALEYATLQEAACPIWVAVIGRPAFGNGRTAWASRAAHQMRMDLPPLDPASTAELARRLLAPAENVPASAVARLYERTQGTPLLLVELVRGLKRDGLVRRSEKTGGWYLATDELDRLPDLPLVQWLAGREIESLPVELAAHARLASILGAEFDAAELEGVMQVLEREGVAPETDLDASVGLQRLIDSGLLVRHRRDRIGFRHSLLRETVYQTVPLPERAVVHRAAYQYYAGNVALGEEQRLPQMALHAARSGLKNEAAGLYLGLAHGAEKRHAYLDAESLYRNAIENLAGDGAAAGTPSSSPAAAAPPSTAAGTDGGSDGVAGAGGPDVRQIEARQGLGIMRFRLGRYEDALKDLSAARQLAHEADVPEREIEALLDESLVLDWLNDWARSAQLVDEAETLAREANTPIIKARLVYAHGRTLHRADKTDQACTYFEQSAVMAEALGADGYETHILSLGLAGWGYSMLRRFQEAEAMFARLITLTEERGDVVNLTMALINRCFLSLLSQKTDRMVEDYRRLIVIAREAGLPLVECMAQKDLGEVQYLLGQIDQAEVQVRRAIAANRQVLGVRARATIIAELLLGRVLVYRGDIPGARDVMTSMRQNQEAARAAGQTDAEFSPGDQILADAVGLTVEGQPGPVWDDLLTRARTIMLQPQDLVEVMELRALVTLRAGRLDGALGLFDAAIAEASRSAEIMVGRLHRAQDAARRDGSATAPGLAAS
jgi:serine/threonine protein kinase/tetratricopeptide (TPR) repeat protein